MSKELENLKKLMSFAFVMSENMVGLTKGNYDEATFIKKTYEYLHKYYVDAKSGLELENSLQRLEAIDNANPSKALERVTSEFIDGYPTGNIFAGMTWEEHSAIKQALLKAQEQEKALKIIFEKTVDIEYLKSAESVDEYNRLIKVTGFFYEPLTQNEFDLLKEYSKTIEMQKEVFKDESSN